MFTPSANPSLSFSLTSGKAVETSPSSSPASCEFEQLTRKLAAGDENAFRDFHARYFDRLYHFLLAVARGQEQEAQEALQQTLLRVLRHIRVFESEEVFWSWLKAIARSAARDVNRKQRRYSALLQRFAIGLHPQTPEKYPAEEDRLSVALEESLAELAPQGRRLLEAKYLDGSSVKELSRQTGLTEKAIESRLDRLRRLVRARVLKKLSSP